MYKKIAIGIILLVLSFFLSINQGKCQSGTQQGASTPSSDPAKIPNPLGSGVIEPNQIIGLIIKGVLGVTGSLALVMFIYGGLVWMTAMGKSESVQKGKDIILWATIGLIVIFSAYALVNFVLSDVIGGIST